MIIIPEIFFFGTLKTGEGNNSTTKRRVKHVNFFSLWKLTHYLFLFYEGNEDEIEGYG